MHGLHQVYDRVHPWVPIPDRAKNWVIEKGAGAHLETIEIAPNIPFKFSLKDRYWRVAADKGINQYEPEIRTILDRFLNKDTLFIDGGANIGLWSSYAAAKIGNKEQVIAIEPNEALAGKLQTNCEINPVGFSILKNAIWSKSNETVQFAADNHVNEAGGILQNEEVSSRSTVTKVQTIAIDDVVDQAMQGKTVPLNIIIKLDVEGVEIPAMDGAMKTLTQRNSLVMYEDHGNDPTSKVTADFLKRGLRIYLVDTEKKQVQEVNAAQELEKVKQDQSIGYNFFACRIGSEFDQQFQSLCKDAQSLPWPGERPKKAQGQRSGKTGEKSNARG